MRRAGHRGRALAAEPDRRQGRGRGGHRGRRRGPRERGLRRARCRGHRAAAHAGAGAGRRGRAAMAPDRARRPSRRRRGVWLATGRRAATSASFTAETTAAGALIEPPSPMPFQPPERVRRRRLEVDDLDRRHLGARREQVVHEARGDELAGLVVGEVLVERAADPLDDAAVDLALDDHRVDDRAAVLDHHVAEDRRPRRSRGRPRLARRASRWRSSPGPAPRSGGSSRAPPRSPRAAGAARGWRAAPRRRRRPDGRRCRGREIAAVRDSRSSGLASSMSAASSQRLLAHVAGREDRRAAAVDGAAARPGAVPVGDDRGVAVRRRRSGSAGRRRAASAAIWAIVV